MSDSPIALYSAALAAERVGQYDRARELLRQALEAADANLAMDVRLALGRIAVFGGPAEWTQATAELEAARAQAEAAGAGRQAATALNLLAMLAWRRGDLDQCQQLLERNRVDQTVGAPGPHVGQWYHLRGLLTAERGDLVNAERLLFRGLQIYEEAHDPVGAAAVLDSLAGNLIRRGKTKSALLFAERSLKLKRSHGDRRGEAITLGTLGRIHRLCAKYEDARKAFEADLALSIELGDHRGVAIMHNSLGDTALLQGRLAAARESFEAGLQAGEGWVNASWAWAGLCRTALAAGELDRAQHACQQMAAAVQPGKSAPLEETLLGLRGALAWRTGDFTTGREQLEQAIARGQARSEPLDGIPWLYELRDLYQRSGDLAKAVAIMAQALDLLTQCGAQRGVADVEDWLRTIDQPGLVRFALQRHFPEFVVKQILAGLTLPEPHIQPAAVLFCDLRDYTRLTEGRGAAEVVELLNEWFAEATQAILQHGGYVDKFIGDAVMALFGAESPREDAAAEAVRAAIDMRDALRSLNLRNRALGRAELQIGIGIDYGEVIVGFIGSHLRQSYTAVGDVVNTASRLESATKNFPGCEILISQAVEEVQAGCETAETQCLGSIELKGKSRKVTVYQVNGYRGRQNVS